MSDNGYHKVLVLNTTHIPINVTSWKRAMILLYKGKAIGVEFDGKLINGKIPLPLVVKLAGYVMLPYADVVLSRKNIYLRDNHTCQYCGRNAGNLTIDHIMP